MVILLSFGVTVGRYLTSDAKGHQWLLIKYAYFCNQILVKKSKVAVQPNLKKIYWIHFFKFCENE